MIIVNLAHTRCNVLGLLKTKTKKNDLLKRRYNFGALYYNYTYLLYTEAKS